jgi:protein phosphatase 1 regulatory subunit 3A/B/C/D/E
LFYSFYNHINLNSSLILQYLLFKIVFQVSSSVEEECSRKKGAPQEETLLRDSVYSPKVVLSRAESPEEVDDIESVEESACLGQRRAVETQLSTPDEGPRRVQRSSSLKTGKTPPGTPSRKKIVRFADVLGLDLADVRTFLDEVPKVPSCAYWDLHDADTSISVQEQQQPPPEKSLFPMFQQPSGCPEFLDRLRAQKVCLENAYLGDAMSVNGTVQVSV